MISILIPCFDYNAYPLVKKIEKQALVLNINFEIICVDDGSFSLKNEINQKINSLTNCKFFESKKNIGRIKNRILLAEKSQYDWVIFIDVDTTPIDDNFLKKYLSLINNNSIIFGGCCFNNLTKVNGGYLRYMFGKKREEKNSELRNKKPYKYVSSSNFLAKKNILLSVLSNIANSSYGNDYIFGSILKDKNINILHVDNQVLINEVDENEVFIDKTKKALENLMKNYKENKIKNHSISILKLYVFLEIFCLKGFYIWTTGLFDKLINENLKSKSPNIFLFDLFRLKYLCEIKNF